MIVIHFDPRTDMDSSEKPIELERKLGVFDAVSIMVGIIIGAAIFTLPSMVATNSASVSVYFLLWMMGGLFSLIGATCFAEFTTTYPRAGGDYVYLSRGLGNWLGFLYVWSEFWLVRPGNVGFVAITFAEYAKTFLPASARNPDSVLWIAMAIVLVLSISNAVGIRTGKWTQNGLTLAKIAGLLLLAGSALFVSTVTSQNEPAPQPGEVSSIFPGAMTAMVFVMFVFGGWNDLAFVAAEVRNPKRNLIVSLVLGVLVVTAIYLLINWAYLQVLGFDGIKNSSAVAADVLTKAWGDNGGRLISLLVCVSCLGSINGMLFTGSRIYYACGRDYPIFRWVGEWSQNRSVPVRSIFCQAIVSLLLLFACRGKDELDRLVAITAPVFFAFFSLVAVSFIVLRFRDAHLERPFRVPLFPVLPLMFLAVCLFMLYSTLTYAIGQKYYFEGGVIVVMLAIGLIVYLFGRRSERISAV